LIKDYFWALVFAGGILLHAVLGVFMWLGSILLALPVLVSGVVGTVMAIIRCYRRRRLVSSGRIHWRVAALPLLVMMLLWFSWLMMPLKQLGIYSRFWLEYEQYEQAVQQWQAGHEPACVGTQACELARLGPYPLVFRWGGFLDNWWGVIYNPSIMPIDAQQQRQAFGGDMMGCQQLSAVYWLCSFT
jgi:hypothetical protein